MLAHGQFGNWCIQHICEHGAPPDKSRATDHVLHCAVDYSMDQFASKIVEKCLKIGGPEFLDHYLSRVCTGRADRPRMPLIDSKPNIPSIQSIESVTLELVNATVSYNPSTVWPIPTNFTLFHSSSIQFHFPFFLAGNLGLPFPIKAFPPSIF